MVAGPARTSMCVGARAARQDGHPQQAAIHAHARRRRRPRRGDGGEDDLGVRAQPERLTARGAHGEAARRSCAPRRPPTARHAGPPASTVPAVATARRDRRAWRSSRAAPGAGRRDRTATSARMAIARTRDRPQCHARSWTGSYPGQRSTGSRGYLANAGSRAASRHSQKRRAAVGGHPARVAAVGAQAHCRVAHPRRSSSASMSRNCFTIRAVAPHTTSSGDTW